MKIYENVRREEGEMRTVKVPEAKWQKDIYQEVLAHVF